MLLTSLASSTRCARSVSGWSRLNSNIFASTRFGLWSLLYAWSDLKRFAFASRLGQIIFKLEISFSACWLCLRGRSTTRGTRGSCTTTRPSRTTRALRSPGCEKFEAKRLWNEKTFEETWDWVTAVWQQQGLKGIRKTCQPKVCKLGIKEIYVFAWIWDIQS